MTALVAPRYRRRQQPPRGRVIIAGRVAIGQLDELVEQRAPALLVSYRDIRAHDSKREEGDRWHNHSHDVPVLRNGSVRLRPLHTAELPARRRCNGDKAWCAVGEASTVFIASWTWRAGRTTGRQRRRREWAATVPAKEARRYLHVASGALFEALA